MAFSHENTEIPYLVYVGGHGEVGHGAAGDGHGGGAQGADGDLGETLGKILLNKRKYFQHKRHLVTRFLLYRLI